MHGYLIALPDRLVRALSRLRNQSLYSHKGRPFEDPDAVTKVYRAKTAKFGDREDVQCAPYLASMPCTLQQYLSRFMPSTTVTDWLGAQFQSVWLLLKNTGSILIGIWTASSPLCTLRIGFEEARGLGSKPLPGFLLVRDLNINVE